MTTKETNKQDPLVDGDGQPLAIGDIVMSEPIGEEKHRAKIVGAEYTPDHEAYESGNWTIDLQPLAGGEQYAIDALGVRKE